MQEASTGERYSASEMVGGAMLISPLAEAFGSGGFDHERSRLKGTTAESLRPPGSRSVIDVYWFADNGNLLSNGPAWRPAKRPDVFGACPAIQGTRDRHHPRVRLL